MKAYVESGRTAQRQLESKRGNASESRLLSNLRGYKQVINTFCVAAIVLTPTIGVLTRSSAVAMFVAMAFLAVICVLERAERGAKRRLLELRANTKN
jgi:hypothetical protein